MTGTPQHPIEHPFAYANTYVRELLKGGIERLRIGLRGGLAYAIPMLGTALGPPFHVLCVLHTSRVGTPLGRYQSPEMDRPAVEAFFARFGAFFAEDARADVWLHSMSDGGTIVLDRYNMVYAYGPLTKFEEFLSKGGVQSVAEWAAPQVPRPHALFYHEEWDAAERDLCDVFESFAWAQTPLRPEDVQYWSRPEAS